MADTIIGTAGIFVTLVMIAAASFIIGLILFGITDLLKSFGGHHRRHRRHSYRGPVTVSPLTLADHVHRAARNAAGVITGMGAQNGGATPADANVRWRVSAEFACGLLRMVDAHLSARPRAGHADTYLQALGDLCAGALFRAHPGPCAVSVHRLLAEGRAALNASAPVPSDLLAPAPELCRLLAARIASCLPEAPDPERLRDVVSDQVRSAVALDLAPCLK